MSAFASAPARTLHVFGDVHGMAHLAEAALARADAEQAHPIFLGDLIDKGPASLDVLRLVLPRLLDGSASMVLGNHDERLLRSLTQANGKVTRVRAEMAEAADAESLSRMTIAAFSAAPYWIALPGHLLVHGAFHPSMLTCASAGAGPAVPGKLRSLSLYGETDGTRTAQGFAVRTYRWIDSIPPGMTVLVGHDTRQLHAPLVSENAGGGRAVFLDTGAAKGGRLSTWVVPAGEPILTSPRADI